ncbi:MAG: YiiX/YebB-like N1pC/P60 family cysteine hydrolase [Candidatus Aenigmarchaeota archaeon]
MQNPISFKYKRRLKSSEYSDRVGEMVHNLEPGDIIFYHGTGAVGNAIRKFTGEDTTHTSIYLGDGEFGEATYYHFGLAKRGAIESKSAKKSMSHSKKIEVYRPKTREETKRKAVDFVREHEGRFNRYDGWNSFKYIANILPFLKLKQTKRKNKFYCSNLAMEAYKRAGSFDILKNVEVDNKRWILPSDIAKSDELIIVGEFSL